ncbi:MAG: cytidine deaminase [Marinilabiliaceae bacterium]|nr:cytidine deaminase [Marinilabiliaceae bacterium]
MINQKSITISYTEFEGRDHLNESELLLCESAVNSAKKAYCPYSKFSVGAAVLLESGDIVTGNNQENAAYPSGLCAERVALFYAGAQYGNIAPKTMAIAALIDGELTDNPVTPCGACRQVFAEIENRYHKPFSIFLIGKEKIIKIDNSVDLLPLAFKLSEC